MFDTRASRAAFDSTLSDESRFREWYDHALPVVLGVVHTRCGGVTDVRNGTVKETHLPRSAGNGGAHTTNR